MSIGARMSQLVIAAAVVPWTCNAGVAVPSVDSQLWSELDVMYPAGANWSATGIFTTRLGNDIPSPTLTAGGVQIDYRFSSWIATGTGYYVSIRNAQSGARTAIWLPAFALTYEYRIGPVTLSDRNRLEQLEGLPGSPRRYRNRVGADWQLTGGHRLTDIFLADETFYDFTNDRWSRNRAQVGVQLKPSPGIRLQSFYMRQDNTFGSPSRLNILGLTLQIVIGS